MGTAPIKAPYLNPRYACFELSIRRSKIHRYGVYAEGPIPGKRKVIEYTGELIGRREAKRRDGSEYTYLFAVDAYWTIDGAVGGSGAEIINHSCEPNLVSRVIKRHILYMSLRPIETGEELTIDYNFSKRTERTPCFCGTKSCRGMI